MAKRQPYSPSSSVSFGFSATARSPTSRASATCWRKNSAIIIACRARAFPGSSAVARWAASNARSTGAAPTSGLNR